MPLAALTLGVGGGLTPSQSDAGANGRPPARHESASGFSAGGLGHGQRR